MKEKNVYIVIGFMLFALFFGAANLIYPAFLGIYSGQNIPWSIIGFCLTGVSLPLLGVIAVARSGSDDVESLARPISKWYAILYSSILYLSIGPFFAIPRTGATSFSVGIAPILGDSIINKAIYAVLFFGLSYFLAIRPSKLAESIGKFLTPTLLVVITILIIASFVHPAGGYGEAFNAGAGINNAFKDVPFIAGLIQGYGTMDALASLVFAILVIEATKQFGAKTDQEITKITLISGAIAILLLAFVYIFVGRIGATSQSLFPFVDGHFTLNNSAVNGGQILSHASRFYLGSIGQAFLAIVIFLACLTTSTGLITSSAEYFHKLMPRVSHVAWATLFTLVSAFFYFGGLSVIINWSSPILYLLYPLTVDLIVLVLIQKSFGNAPLVYRTTIGLTIIPALYDALATLSQLTKLFTLPDGLSYFFERLVPLGQFSMGWISFSILGFVLGLIISKTKALHPTAS
ncbi:TPA: branched-chain amino acid transport system II carrier protein [Streptococcus equi subsp. zooepidemicus]|uniref:branched-chain amino acid transport system II carrier protein n=1 Tax=Streptococcus equi TaxID=1336 RepID=UPI000DA398FA|nr:branched-chain amino acid transport system II carrier protein [Streptococcus equi]MCD3456090.1 branched-chain amino acid transport system II carrier protein [Streptococcus equi subsp. zooepidemicus]SQF82323.1 branched-chain amino acid transport system carrier protein [Streptococcus equi subsp. zooepidemicus]HEK9982514.1 branched-chain amino acid transport system II carrier protein [Streptococcus equi subsp. zooepidemicus]HEK9989966.1 branched-chain amino acid transport system II carrier prot